MANKRKKFIPDNWIELMFGVGASVVIVGALLKITHSDFIFSGNTWLTAGLITEAIIFSISGIQGFMTGDSSVEDPGLQTIEAETQSLQQAVDQTVSGLSSLNKNLTAATAATESFSVPNNINENLIHLLNHVNQMPINIVVMSNEEIMENEKVEEAALTGIIFDENLAANF